MKPVLVLVAALATTPALATQEYVLPTLFDVAGVAPDDVLNIRAEPSAAAEIIGHLEPDAERIEVVAHDASGRWAQINTGERSGWVSLAYLAYRTDVWRDGAMPDALACFGTEPFWSVTKDGEGLAYETPSIDRRGYRIDDIAGSGVFRDPRRAVAASHEGRTMTLVMVPASCSDGMSDRAFGLDATVVLGHAGEVTLLRGCCSIAP